MDYERVLETPKLLIRVRKIALHDQHVVQNCVKNLVTRVAVQGDAHFLYSAALVYFCDGRHAGGRGALLTRRVEEDLVAHGAGGHLQLPADARVRRAQELEPGVVFGVSADQTSNDGDL